MMLSMRSCKMCKKNFYQSLNAEAAPAVEDGMCPSCVDKKSTYYFVIFDYIRDHPNCTVDEIQLATGIEYTLIQHLVSTGTFKQGLKVCKQCKRPAEAMNKANMCQECATNLSRSMQSRLDVKTRESIQKVLQQPSPVARSSSGYGLGR
ncbi:MAG: hypothetical protein ACKO37_02665 [Vampirovibrionales bacterium]